MTACTLVSWPYLQWVILARYIPVARIPVHSPAILVAQRPLCTAVPRSYWCYLYESYRRRSSTQRSLIAAWPCLLLHGNIPTWKAAASVSVADRTPKPYLPTNISASHLCSAPTDFLPKEYYPKPSTSATQRPSTRHTAGLEYLHPQQPESTIQRRAGSPTWPLLSTLSRTVSLGPLLNPRLRPSPSSTKPHFPAVKNFHRLTGCPSCCLSGLLYLIYLPLLLVSTALLPSHIVLYCRSTTAASRSRGTNLIRRGTTITNQMFAMQGSHLRLHINSTRSSKAPPRPGPAVHLTGREHCSCSVVCIMASAQIAQCLPLPVNSVRVISRHTTSF